MPFLCRAFRPCQEGLSTICICKTSDFVTFHSVGPCPLPPLCNTDSHPDAAFYSSTTAYQMSGYTSPASTTVSLAGSSGQNVEETAAMQWHIKVMTSFTNRRPVAAAAPAHHGYRRAGLVFQAPQIISHLGPQERGNWLASCSHSLVALHLSWPEQPPGLQILLLCLSSSCDEHSASPVLGFSAPRNYTAFVFSPAWPSFSPGVPWAVQKDIPQLSSAVRPVGLSAKQNTYLHEEGINEKVKSTKKPSLK